MLSFSYHKLCPKFNVNTAKRFKVSFFFPIWLSQVLAVTHRTFLHAGSFIVACGLGCFLACGTLVLRPGIEPCPLPCKVDS